MSEERDHLGRKEKASAEYYALYPTKTQGEICEELQINQSTLSRWKKRPEWQAYVDEILREHWKDAARKAQKQMETMMENGDYKATEYILNSAGYGATKNVNITADTTITLNIEDAD